jgi:TPR repeat protein
MVYSLTLSEDQVAQLTVKAEQGDKEAAFTLYQYFAMVKLDKETSLKWMTLAAHGGHSVAQYNLGMVYSGEIDPEAKDTQKAIYWFRRCAESGDEQSLQKLEQLETDVKN